MRSYDLNQAKQLARYALDQLALQGCRAVDGKFCSYLTSEGHSCAVGHILRKEFPDLDLEPLFNKGSFYVLDTLAHQGVASFTREAVDLLGDLQLVHDNLPEYPDSNFTQNLKAYSDRILGKDFWTPKENPQ